MHLEGNCNLDVNNKHRKPFLEAVQFSFDYDIPKNRPLLSDINLTIHKNETSLLIGPSGSGKSTLALCLNGIYPEAVEGWKAGTIYYQGEPLEDFEKGVINQDVGVVFQDPESQFCMITVERELAFTMENIHIPSEKMEQRMVQVLEDVDMSHALHRSIHELSGGEKQRIALAAVLLLEPSLLILDEPTSNLDPTTSVAFVHLIQRLAKAKNMALVIIEHQLDEWLPYTDRVIALNQDSEIIADGSTRDVFYGQFTELQAEGIHLPRVVTEVMTAKPDAYNLGDRLPSTEAGCAQFLVDHQLKPLEQPDVNIQHDTQASVLSLQHVQVKRKKTTILRDIHLDIQQGEFLGIVGKNGAGKSTLLHVLAGILEPEKGQRTFLERDYEDWEEHELRQQLGFVFQNPEHQFITNTVYDELAFGMQVLGKPEHEINTRIDQLLATFGLDKHRWHNPFSLSGGQKRRLSVATMLEETPRLLLFDEPTFGQDAETTKELMTIINDLRSQGTAIVFVTHDMDLVNDYCERVVVLSDGRVSFEGTPDALWHAPELLQAAHLRQPYTVRLNQSIDTIQGASDTRKRGESRVGIH